MILLNIHTIIFELVLGGAATTGHAEGGGNASNIPKLQIQLFSLHGVPILVGQTSTSGALGRRSI